MNTSPFKSPFQLIGTTVKELEIRNSFINIIFDDETEKSFDLNFNITKIDKVSNDIHQGLMDLSLVIELKGEGASFELGLLLEGCFIIGSDFEDAFEEMLTINGASTLYSIARSIVLSVSSVSVGGDQIVLPMINFLDLAEANNRT